MREPGWWTKAEAAAYLEVDGRTIERRARAGRIQARARLGFPTLYRQADLEILKQASAGEVRTGILEPIAGGNGNGHGGIATGSPKPADPYTLAADPIRQLAAFVVQALTHPPIGPTGPTRAPTGPTVETPWLTVEEAATWLKDTPRDVVKAIRGGKLAARHSELQDWHRWRIHRANLEAFR